MHLADPTQLKQNHSLLSLDEISLSGEIENLFIADAQRVGREQTNRPYRVKTPDVIRVLEEYKHLPFSMVLSVLNFEYSCYSEV